MTVYERARLVSAAEVAQKAGIPLKKRGDRLWCCCPVHLEKTASCVFYPDGKWYCHGCHSGGDAIDLFARLHGCSKLEAAKRLSAGDYAQRLPDCKQTPRKNIFLSGHDSDGFSWGQLCILRHAATEIMETVQGDDFWKALKIRTEIDNRLEEIWEMDEWNR